jgi:hypothetical protein
MADIIREDILQKLVRIAEAQHRDVNDFLAEVISRFEIPEEEITPVTTLAELGELARKANMRGTGRVTAANSREILNTEYAEYLQERLRDNDDHPR